MDKDRALQGDPHPVFPPRGEEMIEKRLGNTSCIPREDLGGKRTARVMMELETRLFQSTHIASVQLHQARVGKS